MADDNVPHVIVACWTCDPGVKQVFGPFRSRAEAEGVLAQLRGWPVLDTSPSEWSVMPCTPLMTTPPLVTPPLARPSLFWPNGPYRVTCDTKGVVSGSAA